MLIPEAEWYALRPAFHYLEPTKKHAKSTPGKPQAGKMIITDHSTPYRRGSAAHISAPLTRGSLPACARRNKGCILFAALGSMPQKQFSTQASHPIYFAI